MMIYGLDDLFQRRRFIEEDDSNEEHKQMEHRRLDALLDTVRLLAVGPAALLGYFGDKTEPCGICDNCLKPS